MEQAACVRIRSEEVFFRGLDFELKTGKPKQKCWSNIDNVSLHKELKLKQSPKRSSLSPQLSLNTDYIDTNYQILFERPKLSKGECEEFAHYEDIAYNIVDEILEAATTILRDKYVCLNYYNFCSYF